MGGYRETTVLQADPQQIFCENAEIPSGGAGVPGPPALSGVIRVGIHIGWDDKGFSLKYRQKLKVKYPPHMPPARKRILFFYIILHLLL